MYRVIDRIIVIKVQVQRIIISLISDLTVYSSQCGLDYRQQEDFYDSLINVVWKLGKKEILVIAGYFIGHIGNNQENYKNQHEGYGYGVTNKEEKSIHEFCAAMNITVVNKLFKRRASHWVNYESGPSKTQVGYCLVRRSQRRFWKGIKILSSDECTTQHKLF